MTKTAPDKDGDWTKGYKLKWDAWNRLVAVRRQEDDTLVATYHYDGLFRRTHSTVDGTDRHFLYDRAWRILEERPGSETASPDRLYTWGLRHRTDMVCRDAELAAVGGSGSSAGSSSSSSLSTQRHYVAYDWISLAAANGAPVERYGYSAFGQRKVMDAAYAERSGSEYAWSFAFHGQFEDAETGWINYGFRYYVVHASRWLNRDYIESGNNDYQFVTNRPTSLIDVIGLFPEPEMMQEEIPVANRDEAWKDFHEEFGQDIAEAARRYCVPIDLLSAMLAHEQGELAPNDYLLDGIRGGGIGPAQLAVSRVINEGVSGIDANQFKDIPGGRIGFGPDRQFVPTFTAASQYRNAVIRKIKTKKGAIDVLARYLKKLHEEFCVRIQKNAGEVGGMAPGARISFYMLPDEIKRCCGSDCEKIVNQNTNLVVIGAISAEFLRRGVWAEAQSPLGDGKSSWPKIGAYEVFGRVLGGDYQRWREEMSMIDAENYARNRGGVMS